MRKGHLKTSGVGRCELKERWTPSVSLEFMNCLLELNPPKHRCQSSGPLEVEQSSLRGHSHLLGAQKGMWELV